MDSTHDPPQFNLWSAPWITAERVTGGMETVGIEQALLNAADYRALFDPSPLVIVSVHRLLVAILQDIFQPEYEEDLLELWEAAGFPPAKIQQFGDAYAHRFDLFSEDAPFLQSADIPLYPEKKGQGKPIGELVHEQTAGTAVVHYYHVYDGEQILCSTCCAKGLSTIPTFSQPGGRGFSTSVNGIPPIYVIPSGKTYYHSLISCLITPDFQPTADRENDIPWWRHAPIVGKKEEVLRVGYLHGLTFPARQVRLYPTRMEKNCTRCGKKTEWGAKEMSYEPGESRPKESPFWRDPFVAYRHNEGNQPVALRPKQAHAVWREYGSLFLPQTQEGSHLRPAFIGQLEVEEIREALPYGKTTPIPFQTFGLRIDQKKIFEWESSGFLVPPRILSDVDTAVKVTAALDFAFKCDGILKNVYAKHFSGPSAKYPNAQPIKGTAAHKNQMTQAYWQTLGDQFQEWILRFTPEADIDAIFEDWLQIVIRAGATAFRNAAQQLNSGASTALICEEAINHCRGSLYSYRNKLYPRQESKTVA